MADQTREIAEKVSAGTVNAMQLFTGSVSNLRNATMRIIVDSVPYTVHVDSNGKARVTRVETTPSSATAPAT